MRDNESTLPDYVETRYRASRGQSTLNVELGLVTKRTYNPSSISLNSGGGGGTVSGTGVVADLTGGTSPGGSSCFRGATLITLWGGKRIRFDDLYEMYVSLELMQRMPAVLCFEGAGQIGGIYRSEVNGYYEVNFSDKVQTDVVGEHRYLTDKGYVPIKDLVGKYVRGEKRRAKVLSVTKVRESTVVYNAFIKIHQNYCADGHFVHNLKPIEP